MISREPKLHSQIDDQLPVGHPLAFENVYCAFSGCGEMVHAGNNENMETWVETGRGPFCLRHFVELDELLIAGDADDLALPEYEIGGKHE